MSKIVADAVRAVWNLYNKKLDAHPFKTKVVICLGLSGTADITAQIINHTRGVKRKLGAKRDLDGDSTGNGNEVVKYPPANKDVFSLDSRRQFAIAMYATMYQAPFGHWWYPFIDRQTKRLPPALIVPAKVALDQCVDATLATSLYMSFVPWAEGRADKTWVYHKLRLDFVPTYLVDCLYWPLVMTANFRYVPVKHQLLFSNVAVFAWSTFISLVCHDDSFLRRLDAFNFFATDDSIAEDMQYLASS